MVIFHGYVCLPEGIFKSHLRFDPWLLSNLATKDPPPIGNREDVFFNPSELGSLLWVHVGKKKQILIIVIDDIIVWWYYSLMIL